MPSRSKKTYMVIGLGRFGSNVASTLYAEGHEVLAVDTDMSRVQSIVDEKLVEDAVQIDAIDSNALRKLELEKFEAIIVAVGSSIESSVLITANLKELGYENIIAKASNALHGKILEKIGVKKIIYPEAEMGRRLAKQILGISFLEEFALSDTFSIAEVALPEKYCGKAIVDSNIRSDYHLNILAIRRAGGHFSVSPNPKTNLQKEDHLLVMGTHDDIDIFRTL
jgi:trk system potassium uptake protein